jgi:hypothetical protein
VEAIHIPLHLRAFLRGTLNPISALCVSILFLCIWCILPLFLFSDYTVFGLEDYGVYSMAWVIISGFRCVIAGLIALLYLIYMCFAAPAVHFARLEKKKRVGKMRGSERLDGDEVQLTPYDYGNGDGKV